VYWYQTNFNNFNLGPLPGQQGWFNPDPALYMDATIEEAIIFSGREVHLVPQTVPPKDCLPARFFGGFGAGGIQYLKVGYACRSAPLAASVVIVANAVMGSLNNLFIWANPATIYAYDGAVPISTGVTFETDKPNIVKAIINFTTKKWNAYVDGDLKLTNLDLFDVTLNDIQGFGMFAGAAIAAGGVMDDFFVGDFDPDLAIYRRRKEV